MHWTEEVAGHHVPIQYDLRENPWRLLVACTLLRRTGGHVVKPVLEELFDRWPEPLDFLTAPVQDVTDVVRPCGLHNVKGAAMLSLTVDLLNFVLDTRRMPNHQEVGNWKHAGGYITWSWAVFIDRSEIVNLDILDSVDHVLGAWARSPLYDYYRLLGYIPAADTIQPR